MKVAFYRSLILLASWVFIFGCEEEKNEFIQPSPEIEQAEDVSASSFVAKWLSFPSVDYYLLDVALDADFEIKLSDEYPIQVKETSYEIQYLNPATDYYYRVGAQTVSGSTINFSEPQLVTTTTLPIPLALDPITIDINQITVAWSAVEEADGYQLDLSSEVDFENIISTYDKNDNQDTVLTITELEEMQGYFYRVKSKRDGYYSAPSNIKYAVTIKLEKPVISEAIDIQYNAVTLEWESVVEADSYELEVSTDPLFDERNVPTLKVEDITDTQTIVNDLDGNTVYYFRLRAKQDTFYSSYSTTIKVQTTSLEKPQLLEPTSISVDEFSIGWTAVSDAEVYEIDLAVDNSFRSILPIYSALNTDALSYAFTGLTPDTDYYLRVRAQTANTYSDYSEIFMISTLPLQAPQELIVSAQTLNSFSLSWTEAEGAKSYLLSVAENSDFSSFLNGYEGKEIIGNSWEIEGTAPQQTYYVRISSKNGQIESSEQASITVDATISPTCMLSQKSWDNGWRETYTYQDGLLQKITGDNDSNVRYEWELTYLDGRLESSRRYEEQSPNILVLSEEWQFGYQGEQWVSLQRQDQNNTTLEYITLDYDANGRVIQIRSYTDQTQTTLNTEENYIYSGDNIIEARDQSEQLVKSWKYTDHFNPEYNFSPQLRSLLYDPTGSSILGFRSKSVMSFYQRFVSDNWENHAYIYDTNEVGMPTKVYSGDNFPTQTYIYQSCGF